MRARLPTLLLLTAAIAGCAGHDPLPPREPRTPAEESLRVRPPAAPPRDAESSASTFHPGRTRSSRLAERGLEDPLAVPAPTPQTPRTRPIEQAQDALGRLEGVWTYARIQHPSGVHTRGVLEGHAIVCGDVLQYQVVLDVGQIDDLRRRVLFEAGGFTLTPALDGSLVATPRGGFGNMDDELRSLPREGDPQRTRPEPYSAQDNPWTRDRTQAPPRWDSSQDPTNALEDDRVVSPLATRRRVYFLGDDVVRIETTPDRYFELTRVVTDRIQGERQRAFVARARTARGLSPEPPASRFEALTPPAVTRHRERRRAVQGVWSVEEIVNPERTPKHQGVRGEFTWMDGYLLYRISFNDQTDLLGQTLTFFQIGLRRYVVTEHDEVQFEDVFGISNLTRFMRRLPAGRRSRHALTLGPANDTLELRSSPLEHIALRRVNEPRFVSEERAQEAPVDPTADEPPPLVPPAATLLERAKARSRDR